MLEVCDFIIVLADEIKSGLAVETLSLILTT